MKEKNLKLKMSLGVLAISAFIFGLASCQNGTGNSNQRTNSEIQNGKGDFTTKLPASIGIDEFAGKTFLTGDNIVYDFSDDGTVIGYETTQDWDEEKHEYVNVYKKSGNDAYAYNSEEKTLTLVKRCFYHNDVPYYTAEEYVNAWANPNYGNTYSDEYLNLYTKLDRDFYAKRIRKYHYTFDSTGKKITLAPMLGNTLMDTTAQFVANSKKTFELTTKRSIDNTYYYSDNEVHLDFRLGLNASWAYIMFFSSFGSWSNFNIRLIDLTDTGATVVFTNSKQTNNTSSGEKPTYYYYIDGYAKLNYSITKDSDLEGKIKCSITDFDENLKNYLKEQFADLNYSVTEYGYYGNKEYPYENYNENNLLNDLMDFLKDFELSYSSEGQSSEYTVIDKNATNNTQDKEDDYEIDDSEVPISVNSISLSDGEWIVCQILKGVSSFSGTSQNNYKYKTVGEGKKYMVCTVNQEKITKISKYTESANFNIRGSVSDFKKRHPEAEQYIQEDNKLIYTLEYNEEQLKGVLNNITNMIPELNNELSTYSNNSVSLKTNSSRTKYKIYSNYEEYGETNEDIWYFIKK